MALVSFQNTQQVLPHLPRLLAGVHSLPDTSLLIIADNRGRLFVVSDESFLQGLRIVIASLDKWFAGYIVLHVFLRRIEGAVV